MILNYIDACSSAQGDSAVVCAKSKHRESPTDVFAPYVSAIGILEMDDSGHGSDKSTFELYRNCLGSLRMVAADSRQFP